MAKILLTCSYANWCCSLLALEGKVRYVVNGPGSRKMSLNTLETTQFNQNTYRHELSVSRARSMWQYQ